MELKNMVERAVGFTTEPVAVIPRTLRTVLYALDVDDLLRALSQTAKLLDAKEVFELRRKLAEVLVAASGKALDNKQGA